MNWEETKKEIERKHNERNHERKSKIDTNPTSIDTVNGIPFSEWVCSRTQAEILHLLESLGNRRDVSILD